MKISPFLLMISIFFFLTNCGDGSIDYREKIIGKWELKNVGDLQNFHHQKSYLLKNATLVFNDNGTLETKMRSSKAEKTWISENGTWSMPREGKVLSLKSETGPFKDNLEIFFTDERTFHIILNDLEYIFIKV